MKSKKKPVIVCPNCLTRSNDKTFKSSMIMVESNGYHCRYCKTDFTKSLK